MPELRKSIYAEGGLMSLESQRAATANVMEKWFKEKNNPLPLIAAAAAAPVALKGGQMAGKAAVKGAEVGTEVGLQAADDITDWLLDNPDEDEEEKKNAIVVDMAEAENIFDWDKRDYVDFDGDWVYYSLPRNNDDVYITIKIKFDPDLKWDFEPWDWDENGVIEQKLTAARSKAKRTTMTAGTQTKLNPDLNIIKGGNEMTTEQKVVEQQTNPPANPTLYDGVTDPNFLPPKAEVKSNPPANESLDKEWESATTPEAKKAVSGKAFKEGAAKIREGKKAKDDAKIVEGKSLMSWSAKHRVKKNPPPAVVPPAVNTAEVPASNPVPLPIVNPPVEAPKVPEPPKVEEPKVPEAPKHEHTLKFIGMANPKKGGSQMKVYKCVECNKTFAKGVDQ